MRPEDIRKINRTLENALTVEELIERLQEMDPESRVVFTCDYGDYHKTQQALTVRNVDERGAEEIRTTAYSHSGLALVDNDEENEELSEEEDDMLNYNIVVLA